MKNRRIALLSNVNVNFMIRMLKQDFTVYEAEGYGNVLGLMLDRESSYHAFSPDMTFIVMDLMELLEHDLSPEPERMERWFAMLESGILSEGSYFISDAWLWGPELEALYDGERRLVLESMWRERLNRLCRDYSNVWRIPYHDIIGEMGAEHAFSLKMWYLGGILHTNDAQRRICEWIVRRISLEERTSKKVLLLDLDNTLWGGLAGEADHTPLVLSGDHAGLAFKNLQRVIVQMQAGGVLLGIVSKNNEEDAMKVLRDHPHMALRPEHFAAVRINWEPKHENIRSIARELNLGTDSMVFWDDNPAERELVSRMLPEVAVPDFPDRPEELAPAMAQIYHRYFEKTAVTGEDLEKTSQYAANARRNRLQEVAGDFDSYLKQLETVVIREEPEKNLERLTQLVNKTNQFNLTTKRYEQSQLGQMAVDSAKRIYLYRVKDRFGDNGIVAAGIVDLSGKEPVLEELVMSCRVMGRRVEDAIVEDIENEVMELGYPCLRAMYLPSGKNKPVEQLYERLGYEVTSKREDGGKEYRLLIEKNRPKRVYYANIMRTEGKGKDI